MQNIDKFLQDIQKAVANAVEESAILLAFIPINSLNQDRYIQYIIKNDSSSEIIPNENIKIVIMEVKNKIRRGHLKRDLLDALANRKDPFMKFYEKDIALYAARLAWLENDINLGTISNDDKNLSRNNLATNIFDFLNKLEAEL